MARKIQVAFVALALAAGLSAALLHLSGQVPTLVPPYKILWAGMATDGGTVVVVVADAKERQLVFGLSGSLDRPSSEFPAFLQRWYPHAPASVDLGLRSSQEKDLLAFLEARLERDLSKPLLDKVLVGDEKALREVEPQELLAVVQVYETLKNRNQMQ